MGSNRTEKRKATRRWQKTNGNNGMILQLQTLVERMNCTRPGTTTSNVYTENEPVPPKKWTVTSLAQPQCVYKSTEPNSLDSVAVQRSLRADIPSHPWVCIEPPNKKTVCTSLWVCRADNTLARSGVTIWWITKFSWNNICCSLLISPVISNYLITIYLGFNVVEWVHTGSGINNVNTDRCFTHLRYTNVGPIQFSNVLYKLWIYIGPKKLYNPIQYEYDTNGTPGAWRTWDQYKSQM